MAKFPRHWLLEALVDKVGQHGNNLFSNVAKDAGDDVACWAETVALPCAKCYRRSYRACRIASATRQGEVMARPSRSRGAPIRRLVESGALATYDGKTKIQDGRGRLSAVNALDNEPGCTSADFVARNLQGRECGAQL